MVKSPPWDTPAWRLPPKLRPIYAAVKRVRELETRSGASPGEIAAAHRAVAIAGVQLAWLVDAIHLFEQGTPPCAISGEPDGIRSGSLHWKPRAACDIMTRAWIGFPLGGSGRMVKTLG
jgi:hypothetical protein